MADETGTTNQDGAGAQDEAGTWRRWVLSGVRFATGEGSTRHFYIHREDLPRLRRAADSMELADAREEVLRIAAADEDMTAEETEQTIRSWREELAFFVERRSDIEELFGLYGGR